RRRWNASRNAGRFSIPSALALMFAKPTFMSLAQKGTKPQRARSRLRSRALASKRTIGSWSVGAPFQLGAKFGVDPCGGIEKTSLISLTSEERRTRPHIAQRWGHRCNNQASRITLPPRLANITASIMWLPSFCLDRERTALNPTRLAHGLSKGAPK